MDFLKFICTIKLERISLPAFIGLTILKKLGDKYPAVYIGETHACFHEYSKDLGFGSEQWGYSAVGRILNVLVKRGLATKERQGKYVAFGITDKGIKLLARVNGAPVTQGKPKLKVVETKPLHDITEIIGQLSPMAINHVIVRVTEATTKLLAGNFMGDQVTVTVGDQMYRVDNIQQALQQLNAREQELADLGAVNG